MRYYEWTLTRILRMTVKILLLYPVMLLCLVPYEIFTACLCIREKLEGWWIA